MAQKKKKAIKRSRKRSKNTSILFDIRKRMGWVRKKEKERKQEEEKEERK